MVLRVWSLIRYKGGGGIRIGIQYTYSVCSWGWGVGVCVFVSVGVVGAWERGDCASRGRGRGLGNYLILGLLELSSG